MQLVEMLNNVDKEDNETLRCLPCRIMVFKLSFQDFHMICSSSVVVVIHVNMPVVAAVQGHTNML